MPRQTVFGEYVREELGASGGHKDTILNDFENCNKLNDVDSATALLLRKPENFPPALPRLPRFASLSRTNPKQLWR